jgi:hypothetical protein
MDSEDDARATAPSLEKQQAKTRVKLPSKKKHAVTPKRGGEGKALHSSCIQALTSSAIQSGAEECLPELGARAPPADRRWRWARMYAHELHAALCEKRRAAHRHRLREPRPA